jgi:hypothetical protein
MSIEEFYHLKLFGWLNLTTACSNDFVVSGGMEEIVNNSSEFTYCVLELFCYGFLVFVESNMLKGSHVALNVYIKILIVHAVKFFYNI